jgi:5-dehydro-4-deoxyglucarate dehydratase
VPLIDGVMFFPVTPFEPGGAINLDAFSEHLERGIAAGPGSVFVACGAGEFHALAPEEYEHVVRRAVEVVGDRLPLYSGTGGALPLAKEFAARASRAGASGLLLLPPYLISGPPSGIASYVEQVSAATDLPIIVYNRDTAKFDPGTAAVVARFPNVTGFKDGRGDLDLLVKVVDAVRATLATEQPGKPFQFFNGTPTAEVNVPAYRNIGVQAYSSAVFCFVPEVSKAFYEAVSSDDHQVVEVLLERFFAPLVELRDKVPGYAVSLVKAGVRLSGIDAGSVRPPLVDPPPDDLERLSQIIGVGKSLVSTGPPTPVSG